MKVITIYFEEDDFKELKKLKGKLSWREFILTLIPREVANTEHREVANTE